MKRKKTKLAILTFDEMMNAQTFQDISQTIKFAGEKFGYDFIVSNARIESLPKEIILKVYKKALGVNDAVQKLDEEKS
jgi:hypothetical protein